MLKVGIVTICDNTNYGNRLQNYALSKVLTNMGVENFTLWHKSMIYMKTRLLARGILSIFDKKYRKGFLLGLFTNKMISNKYIDEKKWDIKSKKIDEKFDYFIVGSDQVWNYKFGLARDREFLLFTDYDKTISYAPSFGIHEIEDNYKDRIIKGLNHIKYISVRENEGSKMVEELTGRHVEIVLDPTLLLERKEWYNIEKKPKALNARKYILTYFLGNKNEIISKEIEKVGSENSLDIINLNNIDDKTFCSCGIEEFLYLFDHAELVLTDSFHACIFSMIFNNPFYVFNREEKNKNNMSSRIDTLLKTFKQEHRKVTSLKDIEDLFVCDYSRSYKILNTKRKESLDFLKKSLGISK